MLWQLGMTVRKIWQQGDPCWSIGCGENSCSSFALCVYDSLLLEGMFVIVVVMLVIIVVMLVIIVLMLVIGINILVIIVVTKMISIY